MHAADAFLEAIRSDPEDDTPRLIYADWLDEQGDPQGEFIRVQCEIARLENSGEEPLRLRELRRRKRELLEEYKAEWTAPLDRWQAFVRFHRGIVDEAAFKAADFVKHAPDILAAVPTLSHLRLRGSLRHIAELAKVPELEYLTGLELPMGFPHREDLRLLLTSPYLIRLRSLSLANCLLGRNNVLPTLLPAFQQVTKLNLEGNALDLQCIDWLLKSLQPGQLRSLNLARNNLHHIAAELVAAKDWGGQLEELNLSGNDLGGRGESQLAVLPFLKSLRVLRLNHCQLGRQVMSPTFPELRVLDLSDNGIVDPLYTLDPDTWGAGIRELNLSGNPIQQPQLARLMQEIVAEKLVRLDLSHLPLSEQGLQVAKLLGQDVPLPRLRELHLANCQLPLSQMTPLFKSPHLRSLEVLNISGNRLSSVVAHALLKSPMLDQLVRLQVSLPWRIVNRWDRDSDPEIAAWKKLKNRLGNRLV